MAPRRVFVAVRPSPAAAEALGSLPRPAEPGVRWVAPEQWHVTLRFLGDADPDEVAAALRAVELPRATAVLGPRVARLGRSAVVVPVSGLDGLGAVVTAATGGIGRPPDPRGLRGHLTLARLRGRAACGVAGAPIRAAFDVGEVEVVGSVLRAEGPTHEVLHRIRTREHVAGEGARGAGEGGDLTEGP